MSNPEQASEYLERVCESGIELYEAFVALLRKFKERSISFANLLDEAERILGPYPELFDGFFEFTPSDNAEDDSKNEHEQDESKIDNSDISGIGQENNEIHGMNGRHSEQVENHINNGHTYQNDQQLTDMIFRPEIGDEAKEKYIFSMIKDSFKKSPDLYITFGKCLALYMNVFFSNK